MNTIEIPVAAIRTTPETQPREKMDMDALADYAETLRSGQPMPAVRVRFDGSQYWLTDGFHRLFAHQAAGLKMIRAEVSPGSKREAILDSCGANADHGLRRTPADKRRAVARLLEDPEWRSWSDQELARRCRVSHTFVAKVREETVGAQRQTTLARRDGKVYEMDVSAFGRRPAREPRDKPAQVIEFPGPARPPQALGPRYFFVEQLTEAHIASVCAAFQEGYDVIVARPSRKEAWIRAAA